DLEDRRRLEILVGVFGRAGQPRFHHLRAAEPLSRTGPLPHAAAQEQPAQAVALQLHHSAASADDRFPQDAPQCRSAADRLLRTVVWRENGGARSSPAPGLPPLALCPPPPCE